MLLQLLLVLAVVRPASKINVGLIVPSALKNFVNQCKPFIQRKWRIWDAVLKTSWYFLTSDRMVFVLVFLFTSVLQTSAKSSRAELCSVLSKSLVPGVLFDCWILITSINAGNPGFHRILLAPHVQFRKQAVIWKQTCFQFS